MFDFLYTAVSWVLLCWHQVFTAIGLPEDGGANWALSIVFLVITARLLLFRLFIKQLHHQRHLQRMQPEIAKLRQKYRHDKQTQQREIMNLQQQEGFSPLTGCLPLVAQLPVFIGLLHVLRHLSAAASQTYQQQYPARLHLYGFSIAQTKSAAAARIFGGAPLAGQFRDTAAKISELGGTLGTTQLVILVLVLASAAATLATQLLSRATLTGATLAGATRATPPEGTAATVQQLMLVAVPVFTIGSGLFFPLGVLLYWFVSNLWTAGQQAYVLRFHPQPAERLR